MTEEKHWYYTTKEYTHSIRSDGYSVHLLQGLLVSKDTDTVIVLNTQKPLYVLRHPNGDFILLNNRLLTFEKLQSAQAFIDQGYP